MFMAKRQRGWVCKGCGTLSDVCFIRGNVPQTNPSNLALARVMLSLVKIEFKNQRISSQPKAPETSGYSLEFYFVLLMKSFTIISLSSSDKFSLESWFFIRNYYYITNYHRNLLKFTLYIRS